MRAFHSRYTEKCCRRGKRLQNQLSQDISTKLEPFFFFFFVWCELFALNNLRGLLKIYVLFFSGGGVNFHTCGQCAIRRIFRQPREVTIHRLVLHVSAIFLAQLKQQTVNM